MRRLFKESKKIATFALAAAMAVTAAFGVAKVAWAESGDETSIVTNVSFDLANELVTVVDKNGDDVDSTYYFYTTDKVSTKKIPAANKWKRTVNGTVSTDNIASKKVLYFAKTTTPSYDEVVAVEIPAAPKVKSAKYNAPKNEWTINTNTNAADKFVVISAGDYMSLEDFKATDENNAPKRERFVNSMYGETVYVAIAPVGTDGEVLKSVDGTSNMVAELKADANTGVYKFPEKAVRGSVYSTSKRVKVGNRAGGPAVTIDYANHCIKVSSATEVAEAVNIQEPSDFKKPIESTDPSVLTSGKTVYYFFDDVAKVFDVRTKATDKKIASMDTPVAVPVTKDFEANASIIGGFEQDAYLEIAPKDKGENSSSVSYQYVVLDKAKYEKVVKNNKFDYKTAMGEKLAWKTIKYTVDKNGKVKTAIAKIVNSKGKKDNTLKEGTVVLVREAAKANKPSSKVIIFEIPTEEKPYWKSTKIDSTKTDSEISVSAATVVYSTETKKSSIKVVVNNGKDAVTEASVKDKFTLNKLAVTPSLEKEGDNAVITFEVPDTLVKDSVDLKVAAKAGFIEGSTYTYSSVIKGADLKLPTLVTNTPTSKWTASSDGKQATVTVKVELSENLATYNDSTQKYEDLAAGDVVAKFKTASENYELKKATYAKKTSKKKAYIEFELTYSLKDAAPADGAITYNTSAGLFDAAGHKLEITNISVKADSTLKKYEEPTTTTASAS